MHIYDTLIIGSGYLSAGYAQTKKNCIICEKTELCDTFFSSSLFPFSYKKYVPATEEGCELENIFNEMTLFERNMQNLCGFECAFCTYLDKKDIEILLKCRVLGYEKEDNIYKVSVITNSGIETLYAKNIKDFSHRGKDFITVLFNSEDISADGEKLKLVFGDAKIEKAFYEKRFAIYIPTNGKDINLLKLDIYEKWAQTGAAAKILHLPSSLFSIGGGTMSDAEFANPIEAFEYGISLAKGENM